MKSYLKGDENMTFTAPGGGVTVDAPVLIGSLLVVPTVTAAALAEFAGLAEGVFVDMAKTAGTAWVEGQLLYWDSATSSFTTAHSATARRAGCAAAAAAADDVLGTVRLSGLPSVVNIEGDTIADAAVSPTALVLGQDGVFSIDVPDHATQTLVYKTAAKVRIIDAWLVKDGAGAANTIQLTDGADAAITNAMAAAVDKTITRAGTIDPAKCELAAGATFKGVYTRAAGTMAAKLYIRAMPVA